MTVKGGNSKPRAVHTMYISDICEHACLCACVYMNDSTFMAAHIQEQRQKQEDYKNITTNTPINWAELRPSSLNEKIAPVTQKL